MKRPLLAKRHRTLRRGFAKKYVRWSASNWKNIVFSDEKIFRVRPGGQIRCWKQISDKKFIAKYVIPQVQKAEGVIVWAAMNGHGQIVLKRCPPKVNSLAYQAILGQVTGFIRPRHAIGCFQRLPPPSPTEHRATSSSKMVLRSTAAEARGRG